MSTSCLTELLSLQRRVLIEFVTGEPRQAVAAIKVTLHDADPGAVEGAIVRLVFAGILEHSGQTVRLRPCVAHLDALGLLVPAAAGPSDDGQDSGPVTRYAIRRVTDHERGTGPVVGHVEVPEGDGLMRARGGGRGLRARPRLRCVLGLSRDGGCAAYPRAERDLTVGWCARGNHMDGFPPVHAPAVRPRWAGRHKQSAGP